VISPDSSVSIAAAATWHVDHALAVAALDRPDVALAAHVAYETTAALSRMPEGHRVAPEVVLAWLERRFPDRWLDLPAEAARQALRTAIGHGIRGGALYDAVVGATAAHHDHTLLSADRRAAPVYRALGVRVEFLSEP
jgi:predicted nucleic acid-binding protein